MDRRDFLTTTTRLTGLAAASLAVPAAARSEEGSSEPITEPFLRRATPEIARVVPGIRMHFLARGVDGSETGLIEAQGLKGMEPRRHVHQHEDEAVYLLGGRMRTIIGDREFVQEPGDYLFMPRRIPHEFEILEEPIHVLLFISPAGFEEYFWRFSRPAEGPGIPPPPAGPPPAEQLEAMSQALAEYGISNA